MEEEKWDCYAMLLLSYTIIPYIMRSKSTKKGRERRMNVSRKHDEREEGEKVESFFSYPILFVIITK